jgi:hypothetical protein
MKFCGVAVIVLLAIVALGPAEWRPRTGLSWEIEHFVGYFVATTILLLGWPRPLLVGGALMGVAGLLESLQALTLDHTSYYVAALYGAGGALAAAVLAELFIRVFSNKASKAGPGPY